MIDKSNIKFSIIIPTYNRAHLIGKTIESLLQQTYSNFELIIVDDGSTDNTEAVITKYTDSRILYFKKNNEERGAARNFGLAQASGNYINYFDSDDIAYPTFLHNAYNCIVQNTFPSALALAYIINYQLYQENITYKNPNKELIYGNKFGCNSIFLETLFAKKNLFSTNRTLSGSEDYILWLQIGAQVKIHFVNEISFEMIHHNERSVISTNLEHIKNQTDAFIFDIYNNPIIYNHYKKDIRIIHSQALSYLSLHLMLRKHKRIALKYMLNSLFTSPACLFYFFRRYLAIIKHLLL